MGNPINKTRYHALDEARGFAVLCMVFYHAFYTIGYSFDIEFGRVLMDFFMPAEPYFAVFFIALSGAMCQLTRSNFKRGLKLLCISALLTAVTLAMTYFGFEGSEIYFGILHLLAVGMLLVALINPLLKRLNPLFLAIVFLALFILCYNVEYGYLGLGSLRFQLPQSLYNTDSLFIFGFHSLYFYSADYFPLLPWIFMFLFGAALGLYEARGKFPKFLIKRRIIPFGFIGRHALEIYILHQPVIFGIAFAIEWVISFFQR